MAYSTRILADSIGPAGRRITTFEVSYPRFVHAELMTHREFSRNSASSRAIPVEKMLRQIRDDPAGPVFWGKNQPGMQAAAEFEGAELAEVKAEWLAARDSAVHHAERLMGLGVHKQIANRVTEPWMWITVLVTSTNWRNWEALRCTPFAQPEINRAAVDMMAALVSSVPIQLAAGEWHLPLVTDSERLEFPIETLKKLSAGRCARVSYLTHDGKRDVQADIDLCDRLASSGHWSPFEHVAQALERPTRVGNLVGWKQYRKEFALECPSNQEAPWDASNVVLTKEEAIALRRDILKTPTFATEDTVFYSASVFYSAMAKLEAAR